MKNTNWWLILLQGLIAIVFGLAVILWPIKSLVAITWLIGAFLLIESIILIISSFFNRESFGIMLLSGLVFGTFGLLILNYTNITLAALILFFAIWSIAAGIIQIVGSVTNKDDSEGGQLSLFGGIFSLFVGIFLLVFPIATVTVSQLIFGLTLVISGFGGVVHAFKSR